MKMKNKAYPIFCIIGPSGSGKNEICKRLPLKEVVSYKTRPIREGEVDGVAGHFITQSAFKRILDKMIVYTEYHNHLYGITQGEILGLEEAPMTYVIDYESYVRFKENIKKLEGYEEQEVYSIFIDVDPTDLEYRLRNRSGSTPEFVEARMNRYEFDTRYKTECDLVVKNPQGKIVEPLLQILEFVYKVSGVE